MIDERWRQVETIFHDVLELGIDEREPFLDRACAGDAALRKEVESLIRSHGNAGSFLDSPATDQIDAPIGLRVTDSLAGRTFGRYELLSLLGSGGMGDVYRARDSELKRDIAIKVLPDAFSRDAERVSRFRREAEVLASLNHPNIATIYDFETLGDSRCLVLELVEGETLAERIARGPIPLDEALRLAKQIAEGLEAAHEKGIIHRDLKPANIKITPDGTVKVLDFGLAKVREGDGASSVEGSRSTIVSTPGMIVGTAAYMSPEQARGKGVDRRTDIWAFGCVLYEMLTGRSLFGRATATDTLAAILERDPEWSTLPATTPASVQRLLFRCLDKNLRDRLHDIADARIELADISSGASLIPPAAVVDRKQSPSVLRWSIALASLAALVVLGALTWRAFTTPSPEAGAPASRPPDRVVKDSPVHGEGGLPIMAVIPQVGQPASRTPLLGVGDSPVRSQGGYRSVALTPDATQALYIDVKRTLFVRPINGTGPKQIATGAAPLNFVFANNQWAGYQEGTTLKKVRLNGGPSTTILTERNFTGATWAPENTIIFADEDANVGLQRISADGGKATVLTEPDSGRGELDHVWPEMLPGGKAVLFTITVKSEKPQDSQLAALDLATGKISRFPVSGTAARYLPTGHLIYVFDGKLQAIGFDSVALKTNGVPFVVGAVRIPRPRLSEAGDFDVAANGTLVYVEAPAPGASTLELESGRTVVWVTRDGKEEPLGTPPDRYIEVRVSRDGTRVAIGTGGKDGDIKIWSLASRRFLTQVTSTSKVEYAPTWLDENHIAYFLPGNDGNPTLLKQNVDGRIAPEALAFGPPSGITPDGMLLFAKGAKDLWRLPINNPSQAEVLLDEPPSTERNAVVSVDGRWLAYESDKKKAGEFEIYGAAYPNVGARQWKVSSGGGTMPLWNPKNSPDSAELFYVSPEGDIESVRIGPGGLPSGDAATVVEGAPYVTLANSTPRKYDFYQDRFLLVKRAPTEQSAKPPQILLQQNWLSDLKRPVP